MENQENGQNKILVTVDTTDGAVEQEIDLDTLTLEQVADLASLMPDLRDYYGDRLIKDLKN